MLVGIVITMINLWRYIRDTLNGNYNIIITNTNIVQQ